MTFEALAFFVAIEAEEGRLPDNCVTLVPGSPKVLHLRTHSHHQGWHSATCMAQPATDTR